MGLAGLGNFGALYDEPPALSWQYPAAAAALPARVMLPRTPVRNQGRLSSCTGFAFGTAVNILSARFGLISSPLALYHAFRLRSGFGAHQDLGAYMEPAIQALAVDGAGSEAQHPYAEERLAVTPSRAYREQAADHRALGWYRALAVASMKSALAAGLPGIMAFSVPPGFGDVGLDGEWRDLGGRELGAHSVCRVGYDDAHRNPIDGTLGAFVDQNSWGEEWGDSHPDGGPGEGFFWTPYSAFPGRRWYDAIVPTMIDTEAGA